MKAKTTPRPLFADQINAIRGGPDLVIFETHGGQITMPNAWYVKHDPQVNGFILTWQDATTMAHYYTYSPTHDREGGYASQTT